MPRVLNVAIAVFFLAVLAPVVGAWDGKPWYVQVAIVLFGTPFLLVAALCLSSAARPGSVVLGGAAGAHAESAAVASTATPNRKAVDLRVMANLFVR